MPNLSELGATPTRIAEAIADIVDVTDRAKAMELGMAKFVVADMVAARDLIAAAPDMHQTLSDIARVLSETRIMPSHLVGNEIEWCIDHARLALSKALGEPHA